MLCIVVKKTSKFPLSRLMKAAVVWFASQSKEGENLNCFMLHRIFNWFSCYMLVLDISIQEPIIRSLQLPIISQCNGIFTDQSIFLDIFSHEIGQFQSTWAIFGKDKTMRRDVNMPTSYWHIDISAWLWLQLVIVGIWIRDKFKLKIDRSVKTPWREYRVVTGS